MKEVCRDSDYRYTFAGASYQKRTLPKNIVGSGYRKRFKTLSPRVIYRSANYELTLVHTPAISS
jgi:hypothetical protein